MQRTVRIHPLRNCIFNESDATTSGVNGYLPIAQTLNERHVSATVFHDLNRLMVLPPPTQSHDAFQSLSLIEQPSQLLRRVHTLVAGAKILPKARQGSYFFNRPIAACCERLQP